MSALPPWLLVALGGAAGSVLRFLVASAVRERFGADFPAGTLAVNLLGSLAMGLLWSLTARSPPELRLLLGTGVLGGFTTWSAFNQETLLLLADGRLAAASASVGLTFGVGLVAGSVGMALGRMLEG